MKKFLMAMVVAACALGAQADGDWQTTLAKVKNLSGDTGISGFVKREAPPYITGNFAEADRPAAPNLAMGRQPRERHVNKNGFYVVDHIQAETLSTDGHKVEIGDWIGGYFDENGAFVKGHEVKTLFGMPYGVGQLIMIPLCLIMMYLAIVKGFEPLLLLPIGFGGLLANCPLAGVTAPAMMHDGVITFLALEGVRNDAVKYTRAYMVLQGLKIILSVLVVAIYGFFNRELLLPFLVIFGVFFMIYLVFEAIALTKLK